MGSIIPVAPPQDELAYIHYFCGNTELPADLKAREVQRTAFYKAVVALIRAYANSADELEAAGYSSSQISSLKAQVERYLQLREVIRKASGETLDLKTYEADMRHLIDTYIQADEPRKISPFDNLPLLELIVKSGIADAINSLPPGIKSNRQAVAETIENNVRSTLINGQLIDPAWFDAMSLLLDAVIRQRKSQAISYEEYLQKIADLAHQASSKQQDHAPVSLNTPAKLALYNNLGQNETLALAVHESVVRESPDNWKGNEAKERVVKGKLYALLGDIAEVERVFAIIKPQHEY
jgi:type I restriction enzyme R subunit